MAVPPLLRGGSISACHLSGHSRTRYSVPGLLEPLDNVSSKERAQGGREQLVVPRKQASPGAGERLANLSPGGHGCGQGLHTSHHPSEGPAPGAAGSLLHSSPHPPPLPWPANPPRPFLAHPVQLQSAVLVWARAKQVGAGLLAGLPTPTGGSCFQ